MRKLTWIATGIAIGCLIGAYAFSDVRLVIFGALLLPFAFLLYLHVRKHKAGRIVSLLILSTIVGLIWYYIFGNVILANPRNADGKELTVAAVASDYSYQTDYGVAVEAKVGIEGNNYDAILYMYEDLYIEPGDRLIGFFRFNFTGQEGKSPSTYLSSTGIHLVGFSSESVQVEAMHDTSIATFAPRVRRSILQKIEDIFPEDASAFARALILGDRSGMSYELTTSLTVSGIVHLVAVSGLHVSVLFSLLFSLFGSRRLLTPIVGTIFLVFIAAVTGFTPSIVRACLMNELILLAMFFNREPDSPTALAFAVAVMLLGNPLCVTSAGFQLSVASVLGIQLFAERINNWIQDIPLWGYVRRGTFKHHLRRTLASAVSVSLSAAATTAPLTAMHFGTVSLVGLITNLLTVSLANFIFIVGVVAVALAYLWVMPAKWIAWLISWGIRYIILVASALSSFPFAAIYTRSVYVCAWLVFAVGMILVFWLVKGKRVWLLLLSMVFTLAVSLGMAYIEPRLDSFRVTLVDVGQGQCVLLQSDGKTYMVDCGGDYGEYAADAAVETLFSQGIFSLDGLIVTHFDEDHVGGVPYLLKRIPVEEVYLPRTDGWEDWLDAMRGSSIIWVEEDMDLSWGDTYMQILASAYMESSNESSLCILYQKDNCDILITGDRSISGEADLLLSKSIPDIEILIAGHHGAAASTSEYLLKHTRPDMVLISAGEGNRYGHPSAAVLQRLKDYGCIVRRTDLEGTIIIRR